MSCIADLRPRSRMVFGCGADFKRGLFPVAGEDAREPEGRRGFPAKKIFGGFRISLTAKPSSRCPRPGYIQGAFSATALCYARFKQSVTTFASRTPLPPFNFSQLATRYSQLATRNSQLATRNSLVSPDLQVFYLAVELVFRLLRI